MAFRMLLAVVRLMDFMILQAVARTQPITQGDHINLTTKVQATHVLVVSLSKFNMITRLDKEFFLFFWGIVR